MKTSGDLQPIRRSETAFQIAELRIDPQACEVAGPGGRERLDPKVMDVFAMLASHAGQVVLRDDLLARLWPNVIVTDEVLSRCIYVLRGQLSRAGGSERYRTMIETVPKRGYRLNAEVTAVPPGSEHRPGGNVETAGAGSGRRDWPRNPAGRRRTAVLRQAAGDVNGECARHNPLRSCRSSI